MVVDSPSSTRHNLGDAWKRHRVTLVAIALVGLAAGLRFVDIDANGFNNDEVFSIWLGAHDASYIAEYTLFDGRDNVVPPPHYWLTKALLRFGDHPAVVRLPSVIAGVLIVWLTFRLALELFDLRVATLSGVLIAVASLQVALSRVGRPHMLAGLCALLSLYFFARILFRQATWRDWAGLVVATVAALWTFYTTFLVVLYENAVMLCLWSRHRLSRPMVAKWCASQVVAGLLVLPALLSALLGLTGGVSRWQTRPGLQELVKSAILFGTGDPSYGPAGTTLARILSLLMIICVGILGLWLSRQRGYHRQRDEEGRRVLFVLGAVLVPWIAIFTLSQVHPLYQERYFLFVAPPLFTLFAWILTRTRKLIVTSVFVLALFSLAGSSLYVYYTEPSGEQWREAIAYMRTGYRPDDLVVISPGHYGRPFAYYFYGSFPPNLATIAYTPAVVVENGELRALDLSGDAQGAGADHAMLATVRRVWLVSGYAPVDPAVLLWADENFETIETGEFVGARVRLLERADHS